MTEEDLKYWYEERSAILHRKAREAPPFRTGRDRAARVACHVVAFRILSPIM